VIGFGKWDMKKYERKRSELTPPEGLVPVYVR